MQRRLALLLGLRVHVGAKLLDQHAGDVDKAAFRSRHQQRPALGRRHEIDGQPVAVAALAEQVAHSCFAVWAVAEGTLDLSEERQVLLCGARVVVEAVSGLHQRFVRVQRTQDPRLAVLRVQTAVAKAPGDLTHRARNQ